MTLHVLFDANGVPMVIYPTPREGTEPIEDLSEEFMSTRRRNKTGAWIARAKAPAPTAEEREAARLAARDARRAARHAERDAARRERLFDRLVDVAARLDPDFARAVAELEAEFRDSEV